MSSFPYDAVLFDCDGVLVDSEAITCSVLVQMLGELGWTLTLPEAMATFVGKMVKDEAALIEARTGFVLTEDWLAGFRARRDAALAREIVAIPGAPAAVEAIHVLAGGRIAVASGADRVKINLQLGKTGLAGWFEGRIFSGHEMPRSKPHPDVYLAAAAALGVDPRRCAVVEDTVTGARAGVAAGATVFGYSPGGLGHSGAQALRAVGVARIFDDMGALASVLQSGAS
ncbi:HAD family phosphatase [Verticiella sediminum]|uniref:HAD family phosphatase n=1 Tax=Verticiella sediminum TaxID=1247510 RepID=A0A556AYV1_9BURK|nr:HAD family phosphatase [Verticiella sediminum]TSH98124.1 HAD family phosphatase [Verticiella sediminum]